MLTGWLSLPGCATTVNTENNRGDTSVVHPTVQKTERVIGAVLNSVLQPESMVSIIGGPPGMLAAELLNILREKDYAKGCEKFISEVRAGLNEGGEREIIFKELNGERYLYTLRPMTEEEVRAYREMENERSSNKSREELLNMLKTKAQNGGTEEKKLYEHVKDHLDINSLTDLPKIIRSGNIGIGVATSILTQIYEKTIGDSIHERVYLTEDQREEFGKYYDSKYEGYAIIGKNGELYRIEMIRQIPPSGNGLESFEG